MHSNVRRGERGQNVQYCAMGGGGGGQYVQYCETVMGGWRRNVQYCETGDEMYSN